MRTVALSGKKAAGRVALVDDEDYDLVMQHRWNVQETKRTLGSYDNGPYAVTNIPVIGRSRRQAPLRMHCLIMGAKGIDHIDHDGLNNQRHNLRIASRAQNIHNQRPKAGCSSAFKGVHWDKRGFWIASIRMNGRLRHLGCFASELDAALAYDAAARALFGEFACPNFPEPHKGCGRELEGRLF